MDQNALVNVTLEGGRELLRVLVDRRFPVDVAFWAKPSDSNRWNLYIASPLADEKGASKAYQNIYMALRGMPEWDIEPSEVIAIGAQDAMAKAASDVVRAKTGTGQNSKAGASIYRFRGYSLGGNSVDGALIYPPLQFGTTPAA